MQSIPGSDTAFTSGSPPVLFLIFNRPEITRRTFAALRTARPNRLFIAADGPRSSHPDDPERCQETRKIVDAVDWPCDVATLFRDENLGCERAVSQAISWFFDSVSEGIVLEDDCLPDPSFFRFCGQALERYRDEPKVGVVTGDNFQSGVRRGNASYYFSKYNHCWGWATWKRAWNHFEFDMHPGAAASDHGVIRRFTSVPGEYFYWKRIFSKVRAGHVNSWAYRWTYSAWKHQMLTVTPQVNLVRNIGVGVDATHTTDETMEVPQEQTLEEPLVHPSVIEQHEMADKTAAYRHFRVPRYPHQFLLSAAGWLWDQIH